MGAELSILLGGQSEQQRPKGEKQKQKRKFKKDGVGVGRGRERGAKEETEGEKRGRERGGERGAKEETEGEKRGRERGGEREEGVKREKGKKETEREKGREEEEVKREKDKKETERERGGERGAKEETKRERKGEEETLKRTLHNSANRANTMHHSPFRGLRRAPFSSSSTSISCCSSVPCAASNSAHSYPYPRTHSTVMVIPSVRPPIGSSAGAKSPACPTLTLPIGTSGTMRPQRLLDSMDEQNNNNEHLVLHFPHHPNGAQTAQSNNNNNEEEEKEEKEGGQRQRQSLVAQYGFQTHRPRPPLNRAIPPIPESRSNESIQSGLMARHQSAGSIMAIQQQMAQIIDENNPIDTEMAPMEETIMTKREEEGKAAKEKTAAEKGGKASRLPKMMQRKAKQKVAEGGRTTTPKSPLMSVAHSVKSRLTRLTTLKQSKDAMPMSRSLDIGHQHSRIPTANSGGGDPMTKSWSLETTTTNNNNNSLEMPRRGPNTTLIPSPRGMSWRMPVEEESDEHYVGGGKQVQFAPLSTADEASVKELGKVPEMEFVELNLEKPGKRETTAKGRERTEGTPSDRSDGAPPLPKSSPPQLCPSPSPPKTLRKSPQSFPPMGAHSAPISFADDVAPVRVRTAKSALSVSFGAVPGEQTRGEKGTQPKSEQREGKRRVFSTRSLRLVATRVCEASPLLVRRRRGRSAGRDGTGDRERTKRGTIAEVDNKAAAESVSSARLFRKRHSVPAQPTKIKSKSFSESASAGSSSAAASSVRLRAVRSVTERHVSHAGIALHRQVAPLAESESSRVADENSPAVEQCGTVPWTIGIGGGAKRNERRTFFGGKIKDGRMNSAQKEGQTIQSSSSFAIASFASPLSFRPTLAQLLASPQPRKKLPGDSTETKARSGLIDDEIGDQPMLISASPPAVLSADFRLIDELSNGPSPAVTQQLHHQTNNRVSPSSPAVSSDAPSSVVLIAEQWKSAAGDDPRGEVTVVQSRLEKALKIGGRKRNARPSQSDPKETAKVKENGIGRGSACKCQPNTSTAEVTAAKRPSPGALPPATISYDAKSEDGAAFFPILLSDFRSDLHQLQNSVQRDLEELDTLRLQNAVLREQLGERDRIIESLQKQLRGQS